MVNTRNNSVDGELNKPFEQYRNIENPSNKDVIEAIIASNNSLATDIKSIQRSIKELRTSVNTNTTNIKDLTTDVSTNKAEITSINNQMVVAQEEIRDLKSQNAVLLQREFLNDVIISGIPYESVDRLQIIKNLDSILNFGAHNIHYSSSRTFINKRREDSAKNGAVTNNTQITIRFNNCAAKDVLMANLIKNGPILIKQLMNHPNATQKVSINHRLTTYFSKLLGEARMLKVKGLIENVWFNNGQLFIRQHKNGGAKSIRTSEELAAYR